MTSAVLGRILIQWLIILEHSSFKTLSKAKSSVFHKKAALSFFNEAYDLRYSKEDVHNLVVNIVGVL